MLKILTEILMLKILIGPLFGDFPIRQHGYAKLTDFGDISSSALTTGVAKSAENSIFLAVGKESYVNI